MAPNKSPSTNQRTLLIPTTPDGPPHDDLAPFGVVRQLAMVKADVATSIAGESCEDDDLHDPDRHTAPVSENKHQDVTWPVTSGAKLAGLQLT